MARGLWGVADPKSDAFAGVGAFNLVRRAALERTEGFPWLRLEVADDMGLGHDAQTVRRPLRPGQCAAACWGCIGIERWAKWRTAPKRPTPRPPSAACCERRYSCVTLVALEWAPLAALAGWNVRGLRWSGVAMLAARGRLLRHPCARWKARLLPGLLFLWPRLIAAAIMLRSGWLGFRRGGIVWRGTLYRKEQLLAGRRLKLL